MNHRMLGCLSVLFAAALTGCASVDNERTMPMSHPVTIEPSPEPSVRSISRANWTPRAYVVETDALEHHPTYTALRPLAARDTDIRTGTFPTADTIIPDEHDAGPLIADALAAPFIAGWEVARMPVLMIADQWPGSITTSDPTPYDRYREPISTFDLGTSTERAQ